MPRRHQPVPSPPLTPTLTPNAGVRDGRAIVKVVDSIRKETSLHRRHIPGAGQTGLLLGNPVDRARPTPPNKSVPFDRVTLVCARAESPDG